MAHPPHSAGQEASRLREKPAAGGSAWLAPRWLSNLSGAPVALTPGNTHVTFRIRWLGGLLVRGRFDELTGTLLVPRDDPSQASVSVQISAASINTGIAVRDRHLRRARFLDASSHPVIAFRGGNVLRGAAALDVPGSLTIRGVTHTLVLHCRSLPDPTLPAQPMAANTTRQAAAGADADAVRPMGVDAPSADEREPVRVRSGLTLVAETSFSREAYGVGASTGLARLDPLMAVIGKIVVVKIEICF